MCIRDRYPGYLGRADETLEPVPPLRVPRGTRVHVHVTLRGGAREAFLTNGRDTIALGASTATGKDVVPATGAIVIDRDEQWRWEASATPRADGAVLPPELPDALPFTIIPDMPPSVSIVAPVTDTAIGPTGSVPVIVMPGDDHGVGRIHLQVWREAASGLGTVTRERIDVAAPGSPLFEGGTTLTLDGRCLLYTSRCV